MSVELSFKSLQASDISVIQKCLTIIPIDKEAEKRKSWKQTKTIPTKQGTPVLMFLQNPQQTGVYLPYRFASTLTGIKHNLNKNHLVTVIKDSNGIMQPNFDITLRDKQVPIVLEALQQLYTYGTTTLGLPPGWGKCLHPDTKILKYNGEIICAKDVKVNDELMGDNSEKRKVLSVCEGEDIMYEIIPKKGKSFICNRPHILTLKGITPYITKKGVFYSIKGVIRCKKVENPEQFLNELKDDIFDMPLNEYLGESRDFKEHVYLFHVPVEFPEIKVELDPYILGYFLMGRSFNELIMNNVRVIEFIEKELSKYDIDLIKENNKYKLSNKSKLFTIFRELDLFTIIKIPDIYKINNRENRLKLLAGILDNGKYKKGYYSIKTYKSKLIEDIEYLAYSLGFMVEKFNTKLHIYTESCLIPTLAITFPEVPFDPCLIGFSLGRILTREYIPFYSDYSDRLNHLKILKEYLPEYESVEDLMIYFCSSNDYNKYLGSIENTGIPDIYKNNTYLVRKRLLQGFMIRSIYKSERYRIDGLPNPLNNDVYELAISLGYNVKKFIDDDYNNVLYISPYKPLICQPFEVNYFGEGKYCGFTLDGNGRFLLDNFLVTHNTIMGAWLAYMLGYLTLVYMTREKIRDAWLVTFLKCNKGFEGRIWVVGEKEPALTGVPAIIICMDKRTDMIPDNLMNLVGTLIIDEAHMFCTPTQVKALLRPQARYIIAETATLERDDDMHLMIQSMVGVHGIFMVSTEPYLVLQLETEILVPEEKNSFGLNYDLLLKALCANSERNQMAINIVKTNPSHKFIILTRLADHVKLLELLFKISGVRVGTLYRNQRDYSDSQVLIGTMPKIGVGFDEENACKDFAGTKSDVLILMCSVKKWQQYEQYRGRVMRSDSPTVIWFNDKNKTVRKHLKGLEEWIKKTNGTLCPFKYVENTVILPSRSEEVKK